VEFGAWCHRDTDIIWAFLLDTIWREVEEKFGPDAVKWRQAGCKKLEDVEGYVADPAERSEEMEEHAHKHRLAMDAVRWSFQSWYSLYCGALVFLPDIIVAFTAWDLTSNPATESESLPYGVSRGPRPFE